MANTHRQTMTGDEFLIWCLDQEERYELVDGIPVPLRGMAGASRAHDRIVVNLITTLDNQLGDGPCMPTTADTALRTAIKRIRRPDVMIECTPPSGISYEAQAPIAAFEVLSPSTRTTDRFRKLGEYMRHPTLRHIVLIDPVPFDVLVYSREVGGEWSSLAYSAPEDSFALDGCSASLSLQQIYRGLTTPVAPAVPPSL
jgi:Uma2 family endonuclease